MANRKKSNLNYQKGRQKWRREAEERIGNYTPEEKAEFQGMQIGCFVIIIIIVVVIYLLTGRLPKN